LRDAVCAAWFCSPEKLSEPGAHQRAGGVAGAAGAGTGSVLTKAAMASICSGRKLYLKPGILGVPSVMYSRIRSASPPSVALDNGGPYWPGEVSCVGRWQTTQCCVNSAWP